MNRNITISAAAALLTIGSAFFYACSTDPSNNDGDGGSASGTSSGVGADGGGGGSSTSSGTGGLGFDAGDPDASSGGSCAAVVVEAESIILPADIIYVIDNSCSMGEEINSVEQNINVNFAQIMQNSGIDYRVLMLTGHGTATLDVCIGPPLGTGNCSGAPDIVPNQFYHYSRPVYSHDSLCVALDTLDGTAPDEFGLAPQGWISWLRTEAVKVFVEITDDGIVCSWNGTSFNDADQIPQGQTVAIDFDQLLMQQSPVQFGTASDRNYLWYSIVGLAPKSNPLEPYLPNEPAVSGSCSTAPAPGTGYQWLSKGTNVLRFPVCSYQSYDSVFQDIAAGVVEGTQVPCEIVIPDEPPGDEYDLSKATVLYTPGGTTVPEEFTQVPSLAACGTDDDKFYIEDNLIKLCPMACARVEADNDAVLDVKIPCTIID